jgi:hypothetical protein
MRKVELMRCLHISLLVLIVISGALFSGSKGLLLRGEKKYYVTELMSGGSDDNVAIEFSVILFFPIMIVSLFGIFRPLKLTEYLFNDITYLLQFFFLFFIEAGSILNTMIYDHNIALCLWITSFILLVCLTQFFYFKSMFETKSKCQPIQNQEVL